MEAAEKQNFAGTYQKSVIALGVLVTALSGLLLPVAQLGLGFFILALFTIAVASRITIQIPRVSGHISVSDTFIFLTILLFGCEAAVLLAAVEGFCSSLRFSKKWLTILFNAAVMALSTFVSVWLLRLAFGPIPELFSEMLTPRALAGLLCMALSQYVLNNLIVGVGYRLRKKGVMRLSDFFGWNFITMFVGASFAGLFAAHKGAHSLYL
ncbi:MAG: hypothetical protein ICV68_07715, partial [Pyrinomonadaceae bacterium]|nr:hypothetical protein [Pyrinomonadaceae bacterium]